MFKKITPLFLGFFCLPLLLLGQGLQLHYDAQKMSKPIRQLIKKMATQNEVHSSAVGYGAQKTAQYRCFESLLEQASVEELAELCEHPIPCIRAYAFWGLAKKEYAQLEDVFMAHAADTELVYQIQGCFGGEIPVIDWMTWVVRPQMLDLECKKLDDAALARMTARRAILMKAKK